MKKLSSCTSLSSSEIKLPKIMLATFLLFFMFACMFGSESEVQKQSLPFPNEDFKSLLWVGGKLTAFKSDPIQFAEEGDANLQTISLPNDSSCSYSTRYYIEGIFPDDRLQILRTCFTEPHAIDSLMAYDLKDKTLDEIAGNLLLGSGPVYWNPEQTKGIVFFDSGFARKTLYSIWEGGFGPLDVMVTDGKKSWNLSNYYPDLSSSKDVSTGDAGRADWSQDGNSIVFFASSDAMGKTGSDRFYAEYKLYIMDANKMTPISVLDNIHFPYIIKWSPKSEYIAFIGQYGNTKKDGLWLYSVKNNTVVPIDYGKFQDILWNPDSTSLFTIKYNKSRYSQVLKYDLSEIIKP